MWTRGRANASRGVVEGRLPERREPLLGPELQRALSNCLSCKACTTECPSNVNLSLLKAELLHARFERDGIPLRERMLSAVDWVGKLGCQTPWLANAALDSDAVRTLLARFLGIARQRPLPHYAKQPFDRWFARRKKTGPHSGGRV